MKGETWRRVDDCLADALELPVGEREAYLEIRLGDDLEALKEALRLVGQAEGAERLFAKGPVSGLGGLVAGSRLGPWELVRPLGTGGMGVVWLARRVDGQVSMMAAIKLLPPALSGPLRGDRDLLKRFLMEKQILARLQHPNIARLLDASAGVGDTPNFVMEYVEGAPLMDFVKASTTDRLALFLKICEAVQYAHSNLIVHRDLKPQNILVQPNGEPKLLDFGIGKILNDPAGDASITLRRAFSLDYASPEQIRGGAISTGTDVYSLGLILFEMMTGGRARRWNDKALGEVLTESDRFVLPTMPGMSADLRAVLGKATAVEVDRRYHSVTEFAADVARVMNGWPVEARSAGALYQVGLFARRHMITVGVSAVGLCLIVGLGVWGLLSAKKADERSRELGIALGAEREARLLADGERKKAETQGELARKMSTLAGEREQQELGRLKDVLRVVDSVIVAARNDISKLPGGTEGSIKLIGKTLDQLEGMRPTPGTRANFLLLRAEANGQLAELYAGLNSNVGEVARGREHREKSVALWGELHRLDAVNFEWERGWLEASFRLARLSLPRSMDVSSEDWKEYEIRFLGLHRRAPIDLLTSRAVGSFYFFRGLASTKKNPMQKTDYESALRYYSQGLKESGADASTLRNLALTRKYLAGVDGIGPQDKMRHAQEALRLDRIRAERDQNDAAAKIDVGFSIVAVGDALFGAHEYVEAQRTYVEGYEWRKRLAVMDVSNLFVQRSLPYPMRQYGFLSVYLKDWVALRVAAKEMAWIAERAQPKLAETDLASMAYWRGLIAQSEGKRGEACVGFGEATGLLEKDPKAAWKHSRRELLALTVECEGEFR